MDFASLRDIFTDNLLPIFLCAGTGFVLGVAMRPDVKTASRLAFHIFSPCLIFTSLLRAPIGGSEFGKLVLFTFTAFAAMIVLSFLCGRLAGVGRELQATLTIASVFVNGGNYGLAATKFAFGDEALARALVFFVFSTVIVYTAGVLIASMGKLSLVKALKRLMAVPAIYAMVASGCFRYMDLDVPLFVERSVTLLSDASIPLMLVILGLQISEVRTWPRSRLSLIGLASFLQLIVTPVIALLLARLIGLTGPARQAAVLQSSMPAAVATTILAVEYDLDVQVVTGAVLITTLMSPLTLTPLIAYLLASN